MYKAPMITFAIGVLLIIFYTIFYGAEMEGITLLILGIILIIIGIIWSIMFLIKNSFSKK